MPIYLKVVSIDWHPEAISAELRPMVPWANARLAAADHTWETFQRQLAGLVHEHPGLIVDALVEDGLRTRWLFRARGGRLDEVCVVERFADDPDTPVDLPYDDVVTVTLARALGHDPAGRALEVPLCHADEPALRATIDRIAGAIDRGGGAFVADAGIERFFVELAPGCAELRRLAAVTEPELVARLLRNEPGEAAQTVAVRRAASR